MNQGERRDDPPQKESQAAPEMSQGGGDDAPLRIGGHAAKTLMGSGEQTAGQEAVAAKTSAFSILIFKSRAGHSEPLDEVESIRLRGRGIVRLIGLDACPKLVSLDVSRNTLTDLGETGIEECRSLWILDVSHNSLETLAGLSLSMALGYLDLSNNPIPLEALRSIARSHVLELVLGRGNKPNERRQILHMLPNVWVLDEEFVTEKERREAESSRQQHESTGNIRNAYDSLISNDKTTVECDSARDSTVKKKRREISPRGGNRAPHGVTCSDSSDYRIMERQSRRTQKFFENVVWKVPSRADKADSFRLISLLEYYDNRVVATNKRTWLSTFTHGAEIHPRRDWSVPLPRSHNRVLQSLPVDKRLDVAVLLAVRVTFRDNIPRQVLEEAFLVLFTPHSQIPSGVHSDLSRIPPFVCTALVHTLRSSILQEQEQENVSHESRHGNNPADAGTFLDEMEKELLDALPPVVTGIDNELERWNSRWRGSCSGNPVREDPNVDEQLECLKQDGEPLSTAREPKEAIVRQRHLVDTSRDTVGFDDESVPNAFRINTDDSQESAARTPLATIGLMHLCRRAVILLTRSPTCPNLVERQTGSTNLRLYEQMAPLLARANMSYEDLQIGSQGLDLTGSEIDSPKPARPSFTQRFRTSTDGSGWQPHVRFPRPGERVKVLHNSWSIIVSTCSCGTSATIAPFAGIQDPPYCGVTNLYARDLCYDPRGWWKHAAAFDTKPAHSNDWLYRSSRGGSADGSPFGAMDDGPVEVQAAPAKFFQDTDGFGFIQRDSAFNPVGTGILPATSLSSHPFCSALGVFTDEREWDSTFVIAPEKMINLHNRAVIWNKGFSRTWHGIDDPEVVGRIRPAVSCCLSSDLATERDQILWPLSILGLRQSPGKQGMRGPHPISMFATSRHVRSGLTRSSSLPTKVTGRSANTEPRAATECAWTELKREMGSLKADNRMVPHGANGTRRGKRMVAHRRRAFPLLPIIPLEATQGSNDPANTIATGNVQSKTFASPALDRRDRPRDAAAPKTHLSDGGVFELTQVDNRSSKLENSVAIDFSPETPEAVSTVKFQINQASTGLNETLKRDRQQDNAKTPVVEATWKPNACRPLQWFPVSSRHRLLVDARSIATTSAPALTGTTKLHPNRNVISSLTAIRTEGGDDGTNDRGREDRTTKRGIQEMSGDGGKLLAGLSTVSSVGLVLSPIKTSLA